MCSEESREDTAPVAGSMKPADLGIGRLFWTVGEAVVVAEMNTGRIVLWNAAAEEMFGYTAAEAVNLRLTALMPGRFRDQHAAAVAHYRATGHGLVIDGRGPVEVAAVAKTGEEFAIELSLTPVTEGSPGELYVLALIRDVTQRKLAEEAGAEHRLRLATLLRVARQLAAEAEADRVLASLLDEAVAVVGGEAGAVLQWDESRQGLSVALGTVPIVGEFSFVPLGQGAVGQAVERRRPVIVNDYQRESNVVPSVARGGVLAALAAPLMYEGRLLGGIAVSSSNPTKRFGPEDAEIIELLAGIASATLVGLERARLEGVMLAARTAQHELNNKLTVTAGYAALLARDPSMPPRLQERARKSGQGAWAAADIVRQLQELTAIHETRWGTLSGSTIDLHRSAG